MERKHVKVWYDAEGDYLEVIFERKEGYFRETANDQVMEKVDADGNVVGFSVLKVSALKEQNIRSTARWALNAQSRNPRARRDASSTRPILSSPGRSVQGGSRQVTL